MQAEGEGQSKTKNAIPGIARKARDEKDTQNLDDAGDVKKFLPDQAAQKTSEESGKRTGTRGKPFVNVPRLLGKSPSEKIQENLDRKMKKWLELKRRKGSGQKKNRRSQKGRA